MCNANTIAISEGALTIISIYRFICDIIEDETISLAGELTYKLMLSIFPLVLFLLSLLGYLQLDISLLEELSAPYLPEGVHDTLLEFIRGRALERNAGLLSVSLAAALFSSSSGFRAMMRGINRAHGLKDCRPYLHRLFLSIGLTLIFCTSIVAAIFAIVLSSWLPILPGLGGFAHIMAGGMMLLACMLVYRLSLSGSSLRSTTPGSFLTLGMWLASSQLFNIYVTHFSSHPNVYGHLASIFILMLWLNMISLIVLLGARLNASLDKKKRQNPQ